MEEIYHLVTLENGQLDHDRILGIFSDIASGKLRNDLECVNYYCEIPVSYSLQLERVNKDSVKLRVHHNSAVVMKHDSWTLVKSTNFPNGYDVHAFASQVDIDNNLVVLDKFAFASIRADRRKAVRVSLDEPVLAQFITPEATLSGNIAVISVGGVQINSVLPPPVGEDVNGLLEFTLNGHKISFFTQLYRILETEGGYSCIFTFTPPSKEETHISHYIYSRQVEIIKGLRNRL